MSEKSSSGSSSGIGFCGLLTIVFITLKLLRVTEVANWSWWWVLSPTLIPIAIVLVFLLGAFIFLSLPSVKKRKKEVEEKISRPNREDQTKFLSKLNEAMKASEASNRLSDN